MTLANGGLEQGDEKMGKTKSAAETTELDATWGSLRESSRFEIRGCVRHGLAHDQHADIVVRGEGDRGMGRGKWSFEVVAPRGMSAKSLWTYETNAEAKGAAEQVAHALLNIAHGFTLTPAVHGVLLEVLTVLDGGAEFQCGPKGKHRELRERIRAIVDSSRHTK